MLPPSLGRGLGHLRSSDEVAPLGSNLIVGDRYLPSLAHRLKVPSGQFVAGDDADPIASAHLCSCGVVGPGEGVAGSAVTAGTSTLSEDGVRVELVVFASPQADTKRPNTGRLPRFVPDHSSLLEATRLPPVSTSIQPDDRRIDTGWGSLEQRSRAASGRPRQVRRVCRLTCASPIRCQRATRRGGDFRVRPRVRCHLRRR